MRGKIRCSVPVSVEERFKTDLTFSFQGKGFWVDLSQGLEYCDLQDTAAAGDDSVVDVDLSYIELPRECVTWTPSGSSASMRVSRTTALITWCRCGP
jgi:hypothetical protein